MAQTLGWIRLWCVGCEKKIEGGICKERRNLLIPPYWDVLCSVLCCSCYTLESLMSTYLFSQRKNDVAIWTTNNWRRWHGLARPFDKLFLIKWSLLLIFDLCFFLFLNHFLDAITLHRKDYVPTLSTILDGRLLLDTAWTYRISFFSLCLNVEFF